MSIFRAYDIRGKYPSEINEEIAFKIGYAFRNVINGSKIVIGRDARDSSYSLRNHLASGIIQSGGKVLDIGLCTTPMLDFAVCKSGVDGGIMISASHNPPEFNGFKLLKNYNGYLLQIGKDSGMDVVKKIVLNENVREEEKYVVNEKSILENYLSKMFSILNGKSGLKIVVDYGNGVGSISGEPFFKKTNFDVISLFPEPMPNFPNHEPNPHVKENFNDLIREVKNSRTDLGIFFDGDADRALPVDENGNIVYGDVLLGILAVHELRNSTEKRIYYDLRSTKSLSEEIRKAGGIPIKMKVGNPYYKEKLIFDGGVMGGECSGHIMFKENHCIDDGLFAMVKLINIMLETGKKLSELSKPFRKYSKSDEVSFIVKDKIGKLREIERIYAEKGAKIEKLDGITVEFDNWWFNVRPSNTEDLLRLNLEANTEELMKEKLGEVEKIIMG